MAKNKKQSRQQHASKAATPEQAQEQAKSTAMEAHSDAPSPSNMAERSKRQKRFGHN
ncbi:hypothetical protein [Streptomyces beihaiensis]|uniref:Small hydrophilic protein n=1 Tax=Streptomyces beihaiensis TaxID=2984495 RepID=A0ABT3TVK9_9ACTN|nr:hypothetical protein [Streptomyces beihaiensis]MCX3061071.1 hypothetical protein [Streptomyces beihaiensis]